jgi:hypothetical protein
MTQILQHRPASVSRRSYRELALDRRAPAWLLEPSKETVVENLRLDFRFALRQLVKQPAFTVTAMPTLALGVAASVAVFGFVDAALIEPLPYPEPARLVHATESTTQIPRANLSYPDYLDWKRLRTAFSSLDVFTGRGYMLSTSAGAEFVPGARVSDGFFRTLRVHPAEAFRRGGLVVRSGNPS